MDTDLATKNREELLEEVKKLRAGIRAYRASSGRESRLRYQELCGLVPEKSDPQITEPYRRTLDRELPGAPTDEHSFTPDGEIDQESVRLVARIFKECFIAPRESGAFLDPDSPAMVDILAMLSAAQASLPVAGLPIVSHARHLLFSLEAYARDVSQSAMAVDWGESWQTSPVTDQEWTAMQRELYAGFMHLAAVIMEKSTQSGASLWAALGALAHSAFHLGIIQVKYDALLARG